MTQEFATLGKDVKDLARKLDTFETPTGIVHVEYTSDEVTAICPVTGQPDWYVVTISLVPDKVCIESKSLKLYLQSYRNEGHFCEQFADIIAAHVFEQVQPFSVDVKVHQKPRGGISIDAQASRSRDMRLWEGEEA